MHWIDGTAATIVENIVTHMRATRPLSVPRRAIATSSSGDWLDRHARPRPTTAAMVLSQANGVKPAEHTTARPSVIDDLRDLISALDRRTPHLERKGERDIALVSAALRAEAVQRIAELDGTAAKEAARTPPDTS
jgi:hypothetical protein